jgi:hypothetical protein
LTLDGGITVERMKLAFSDASQAAGRRGDQTNVCVLHSIVGLASLASFGGNHLALVWIACFEISLVIAH